MRNAQEQLGHASIPTTLDVDTHVADAFQFEFVGAGF